MFILLPHRLGKLKNLLYQNLNLLDHLLGNSVSYWIFKARHMEEVRHQQKIKISGQEIFLGYSPPTWR